MMRLIASGSPGRAGVPPAAAYTTASVELVWSSGRWLVWDVSSLPGPSPVNQSTVAPSGSSDFAVRLAGFEIVKTVS